MAMRTIDATAAVQSQTGSIFGADAAPSSFPFKYRRSANISAIFWLRSSLFFGNAVWTIDCGVVAAAGATRDRDSASVFKIDAMQSLGVAPKNAGTPPIIS